MLPKSSGETKRASEISVGYALEAPERFGVWGGASEADRSRLRRGLSTSGSSHGWEPTSGGDAA
jgi:hypothetical protein